MPCEIPVGSRLSLDGSGAFFLPAQPTPGNRKAYERPPNPTPRKPAYHFHLEQVYDDHHRPQYSRHHDHQSHHHLRLNAYHLDQSQVAQQNVDSLGK